MQSRLHSSSRVRPFIRLVALRRARPTRMRAFAGVDDVRVLGSFPQAVLAADEGAEIGGSKELVRGCRTRRACALGRLASGALHNAAGTFCAQTEKRSPLPFSPVRLSSTPDVVSKCLSEAQPRRPCNARPQPLEREAASRGPDRDWREAQNRSLADAEKVARWRDATAAGAVPPGWTAASRQEMVAGGTCAIYSTHHRARHANRSMGERGDQFSIRAIDTWTRWTAVGANPLCELVARAVRTSRSVRDATQSRARLPNKP